MYHTHNVCYFIFVKLFRVEIMNIFKVEINFSDHEKYKNNQCNAVYCSNVRFSTDEQLINSAYHRKEAAQPDARK